MCAATAGDGAALASAPSSTDRRPTSAECGVRPSSALSSSCMGRERVDQRASGVPWSGCRSWCPSGEKNPGAPRLEAAITQRLAGRQRPHGAHERTALLGRCACRRCASFFELCTGILSRHQNGLPRLHSHSHARRTRAPHTRHAHTHINTHTPHITQCTRLDPFRRFTES